MKCRNLIICVIVVLAGVVALMTAAIVRMPATSAASEEMTKRVLIDVGHGGVDGGAVSISGVKEADINLEIALRLKDVLKRRGYDVVMTREQDVSLGEDKNGDMRRRRELIETSGQAITISIHQNFFPDSSCSGPQVFYAETSLEGRKLADIIQQHVNVASASEKPRLAMKGDYYIVRSGSVPAVIIECGFISNPEEEAKLLTPSYQLKLAKAISDGAQEYLNSGG